MGSEPVWTGGGSEGFVLPLTRYYSERMKPRPVKSTVPEAVDLLIIGSGAAGLTAALTASLAGLTAAVLEHSIQVGGTSARSSGTVWVPGNHYLGRHAREQDLEEAEAYLEALVSNRGSRSIWAAFLDKAPAMLEELDQQAGIGFRPFMTTPDYRQDLPGAGQGGRPLEPLVFDGRELGAEFERLAPPLPELALFGGMMVTRTEAAALLRADRSLACLGLGLRLVGRYLKDRIRHQRGTRLVMGNALVARLFKALIDRGVPVITEARAGRLLKEDGRISGAEVTVNGRTHRIVARKGVVMAGGGFPANSNWREVHLPAPAPQHTPAADGADGSSISLAVEAGGELGPDGLDNGLWFPSSLSQRADGSTAVYPHIALDRSKPGLIAVNTKGERFVNEAVSYHEFVRAMYRANEETPAIPAWLICDREFIRRYGLGMVRPRAFSLRRHVKSGYLKEAQAIADLARLISVDENGLQGAIERYNGFVASGKDEDFAKGENAYDRGNGDPDVSPNPCLGPISKPPFYAVAVWPTPLGTSRGLSVDVQARVCGVGGVPIPGLYACGNDMQSAFGGEYPGAGGQLGQGMTFAWIAAKHAAGQMD